MLRLPNDIYNNLKWLGMIVLPALGTAYFIIGEIFDWPRLKEVLGFSMVVMIMLNALVWYAAKSWYESDERFDGHIELEEDEGGMKKVNMVVDGDPETLLMVKNEISFKVRRH